MTVGQTFKTWSLMETILSVVACDGQPPRARPGSSLTGRRGM